MQFSTRNKAKMASVTFAVLLIVSVSVMSISVQPIQLVQAQLSGEIGNTPSTVYGFPKLGPLPSGVTPDYSFETNAYLAFSPNPIGVGQTLLVNVWMNPGDFHGFYRQGCTVTIEKPDGDTDVVGPFNTYLADATAWFQYVVNQVGTWKLKFEHPGTYIPAGVYVDRPGVLTSANYTLPHSVYYEPSSTGWQELTVQQDFVYSWPPSPLPTDYWNRPITPENREWWTIAGNYPWSGVYYYPGGRALYSSVDTLRAKTYKYTPYVQAPNTAHIVWKRQGAISGLIGGDEYQTSLMSGGDTPAIIYSGRCYQAITKSVNGVAQYFFQCYDLRTGEVYWENPTVSATFYRYSLGAWGAYQGPLIPSNILYEVAPAAGAAGAEANENVAVYLVATSGGRLYKWDPWTGAMSLNVSIAPLTTAAIYNNEWVVSVQTINATARLYRLINWTMRGSSTNFATRIANNITWPRVEVGSTVDWEKGVAIMAMTNAAIDEALGQTSQNYNLGYFMESVDMRTGAVLFSQRSTELNETIGVTQGPVSDRGKIAFPTWGQHWICFDSRTGKKLWTSEESRYPWGVWWAYATSTYDFNETKGAIFATSYDGIYAIDWDTGKFLWHYTSPEVPFESPYGGVQPFQSGLTMADGKIYVHNCEHSPSEPITRGWSLHCINATTGELIWKIRNPMVPGAVADGYLTASNTYDGYMYVFGKGKSATTVTAPDVAVPLGTAFTIKGTVLDQSPGQPGTPCVSKESMATQMEYLHMQRPIDGLYHNETITGVPVTLTAIGSDGTVIDIGATTSNGYYGAFGISWAPPKEGKYMIMASFAGENSYGSSNAATFVTVGPAVETPETPEIPTPVDYTWTIIGMGIAVIIAVAIVGALLLLKRH